MVTPYKVLRFNGLNITWKETKELLITNTFFTFLQEVLEMASMFTNTQHSCVWKINSQGFDDSRCIVHFTSRLLKSKPRYRLHWHNLGFQISQGEVKIERIENQASILARKMERQVRDQSSVQHKCRTVTHALHDCTEAEQRHVATIREDALSSNSQL